MMVKLEGWCLASPSAASLEGPASHFFLNTHLLISARPATFGDLAGYLLWDDAGQTYFMAISEAEMGMVFQMAR